MGVIVAFLLFAGFVANDSGMITVADLCGATNAISIADYAYDPSTHECVEQ